MFKIRIIFSNLTINKQAPLNGVSYFIIVYRQHLHITTLIIIERHELNRDAIVKSRCNRIGEGGGAGRAPPWRPVENT